MIDSKEALNAIFEEICQKIPAGTKYYVIGGAVLLFGGLKTSTKDVDLVARTQKDYDTLLQALKKIGFKGTSLTTGMQRAAISSALLRSEVKIDLFLEKVCGKLALSDKMASRAKPLENGPHCIRLCANEDVLLFKSITSREGDRQDCEELIKSGVNWKELLAEMRAQVRKGEPIWVTWINERFDELRDRNFNIPIMKEVEKESLKYYKKIEKERAGE